MSSTNSRRSSFYSPSPVSSGGLPCTSSTPFRTSSTSGSLADLTPPSSLVGIHQKLDMVLATSADQMTAIEEIKHENSDLKEQLAIVNNELRVLKEVNRAGTVSKTRTKLPTTVSASVRALHSSYDRLMQFKSSAKYDCEENQKVKEQLLKDLRAKHGDVAETILKRAIHRYYESRRRMFNDTRPHRQQKVKESQKKNHHRQSQRNLFARRSRYVKQGTEMEKWSELSYHFMTEESGANTDDEIIRHKQPWRSERANKFIERLDSRHRANGQKKGYGNILQKARRDGEPSNRPAPSSPAWAIDPEAQTSRQLPSEPEELQHEEEQDVSGSDVFTDSN